MRILTLLSLIGLLMLPFGGSVEAAPADQSSYVERVLDLTNAERQNAGLAPLSLSPELAESAQDYSQVLATSGCFAHTCGPVPDLVDRDAAAGYTGWSSIGENIAAGYATPQDVVAGWMASPGHRANILSPRFTEIGIGLADGAAPYGTYWTQEFGTRPDDSGS
jgi:uncharacterized protein YkwD